MRGHARKQLLAVLGSCFAAALLPLAASAGSLRFFGNGVNDIDRAKIQIDNPADSNPGPPADIGGTDFTIEFWIRGSSADNRGTARCGSSYGWIDGNTILDRDRYNQPRSFGISLGSGRIAFGVNIANNVQTVCGSRDVLDNQWHHVAVQRVAATGVLRIFVDGIADGQATGPAGDLSYPDNGVPGNFCNGSCAFSDPYLVIAAEKHDAGPAYPSFAGFLDELRLSTVARYLGAFTVPAQPFTLDASTAALYHLDETSGTAVGDVRGLSNGFLRVGGNPTGPVWSTETPFSALGAGMLALQSTSYGAGESAGSVTVTVARTGGSSGAASVTYQTSGGTATPGSDYEGVSGVLSWASGDSSPKTFTILLLDDAIDEVDETAGISLTGASGASIGSPSTATLTITDDDLPPSPGVLRFQGSSQSVPENGGTVTLTVTRTGGSDGAVTVDYASANGTAQAGSDFTGVTGTLAWNPGDASSRTISVPILEDTLVEGSEAFTVVLSGASGGASLGSPSSTSITITDDDAPPPGAGTLQFSVSAYSVAENDGAATVTVTRNGGSGGAVSVPYSSGNGTAVAGSDYSAVSGVLNWASGDAASKSFSVPVFADAAVEGDETVQLALGAPSGGATLGSPASATLTIRDSTSSDPPAGFLDDFDRASGANIGNGWLEEMPAAFSLGNGIVVKNASPNTNRDSLVYRPAAENALDGEATIEMRLRNTAVGYPQVFVRLQTTGLGVNNAMVRYVLYIDGQVRRAVIARQAAGNNYAILATLNLSVAMNTTDSYRLCLRATGTDPVALEGRVERFTGGGWQPIGQANLADASASRVRTAGSAGFGGFAESSYTFDNFRRTTSP